MANGIRFITYHPDLGVTPARVNIKTGELQINLRVWNQLPQEHKFFVLLHEDGHARLQTFDEHKADEYARQIYLSKGYSLKSSITALTRLLAFNKPEDYERVWNQYMAAAQYDYHVNGNKVPLDQITSHGKNRI